LPFLAAGGVRPIPRRHESRESEGLAVAARIRTYVKFTDAGAELFADGSDGWSVSRPTCPRRQLVTLEDAGGDIMKLAKASTIAARGKRAIECLIWSPRKMDPP